MSQRKLVDDDMCNEKQERYVLGILVAGEYVKHKTDSTRELLSLFE